ncbi:MAG TPA: prolyl oligopeptidase family serine peptidase, partial [Chthonomonadaceae bacterium]|nr:prolyl oligopeptidase family serine peptidase [Chthonomonadaceae bacterium]
FSAGGHLVLATAIHFDKRAYEPIDAIDKVSCKPDFVVAVYPGYLAVKETGALEPYMRVPAGTPPVMLVHATDDTVSDAENSIAMYLALKRAGIPVELHLYASGGHGFGVRKSVKPCSTWPERCVAWLQNQGVLKPSAAK